MYVYVDPAATKNEIRDALLDMAAAKDHPLSRSRANNLADKFKKGLFDPELAYVLQHQDPTGEQAVKNVLQGQMVTRLAKRNTLRAEMREAVAA